MARRDNGLQQPVRPADVALATLTVWRISHLVAAEDGPADVIARLRKRAGNSIVGELMDCFACLSVWVSAAVTPLVVRRRRDALLTWLALSGAACLLERLGTEQEHILDLTAATQGDDDGLLPTATHYRPS